MARGDDGPSSDVGLLVDAPPGTSALALFGLAIDAEELLHKSVDVSPAGFLYPSMRERVFSKPCHCEACGRRRHPALGKV